MAAVSEPALSAAEIGLNYLPDEVSGIVRRRRGKGFSYHHEGGRSVTRAERARIDALVIPPAWTDVWISPDPLGHLQATGRDDKGRKQYRYHDDWRVVRDQDKFDHLVDFGQALPQVRSAVAHDLSRRGLGRRKVLAVIVHLLDDSLVRIGNDVYAEENETYGLTTMLREHVTIRGSSVSFCFVGKSGGEQVVEVHGRRLAGIVKRCREAAGAKLFVYEDRDGRGEVTADDVNAYLREVGGPDLTARDFRTWGATAAMTGFLGPLGSPDDERTGADTLVRGFDATAERLGNTRSVCRESYVHPRVPEAYLDGSLDKVWKRARQAGSLTRPERAVLALLSAR